MRESPLRVGVNALKVPTSPTDEQKLAQLDRILSSQVFQGAEILKSFLRFVVGKSLEGLDSEIKEYTLATEVFGREDYDPRIDSLVRVQAARLRSKLEEYYASEGGNDLIYLHLPKGHYIPEFAYVQFDDPKPKTEEFDVSETSLAQVLTSRLKKKRLLHVARNLWIVCLAASSVISGVLAYHYYSQVNQLQLYAAKSRADRALLPEILPFWGGFLNSDSPLVVAYSNPIFQGNLSGGLKYRISEFSSTSLGATTISKTTDRSAIIDTYTGVGEAKGVYFLGSLFWRVGSPFRVERSLSLTWEDLKEQNVVFLGGPAENLLLQRLPQQQDFVYEVSEAKKGIPRFAIRNRKPGYGERHIYASVIEGPSQSMVKEDYALISMLNGLEPRRRLLILSGTTTLGTQACAEYVTDNQRIKELIERLNVSHNRASPELPPQFQVLLKVKLNGSVPVQTSYVTHHILH